MNRHEEVAAKLQRVRMWMTAQGYEAVALTTQANFSWITAGGCNHVGTTTEAGVAPVIITGDGQFLIANNIEAVRLAAEEIGDLPFAIRQMNWWEEDRDAALAAITGSDDRLATDGAWPGKAANCAGAIASLRWELLPPEIDRYRELGAIASRSLTETALEIEPGMTEHEIAAVLGSKLLAEGCTPGVLLIAVDERISRFRHPIPTDKVLDRIAMLVIGARKWGLGLSATRLVSFGPLSDELRSKHNAVCAVDTCFIGETKIGAKVADIFAKALQVYSDTGFGEEWKLHHQGGATGYAPRDYRGGLNSPHSVLPNQAFAWNPSITGTKSEDTIIATPCGTEILSPATDWPMLHIAHAGEAIARADILVR
jgi:Xaa-Pro aminopeptidase